MLSCFPKLNIVAPQCQVQMLLCKGLVHNAGARKKISGYDRQLPEDKALLLSRIFHLDILFNGGLIKHKFSSYQIPRSVRIFLSLRTDLRRRLPNHDVISKTLKTSSKNNPKFRHKNVK